MLPLSTCVGLPCHVGAPAGIDRVARLLVFGLADEIRWPAPDELPLREEEFAARQGMRGCVGAVDGTLIPIVIYDAGTSAAYMCRKSEYCGDAAGEGPGGLRVCPCSSRCPPLQLPLLLRGPTVTGSPHYLLLFVHLLVLCRTMHVSLARVLRCDSAGHV